MDAKKLSVLRSIVEFVQNSENILVLKVDLPIDPDVVETLQQELAADPKFRTFCLIPMVNAVGLTIVRVESGGNGQLSVATEQKLGKVAAMSECSASEDSLFNVRPNVKRFTMPVNWDCWFIARNTARVKRIPPACGCETVTLKRRMKLPAFQLFTNRNVWLRLIESKVSIVQGQADSGKRTEIVHHLLETAHIQKQSCRMIYVMEEEVEVLATVVRICEERNESIGTTIGYKLNINAQVGEMNNVVFCTTQTLMFSLLSSTFATALGKLTHLIVDCGERHANEMSLLLSLVKIMRKHYTLKLVLLSSRDDTPSSFSEVFPRDTVLVRIPYGEPTVHFWPDKPDGVEYVYLDEILERFCSHESIKSAQEKLPTTENALKLMADLQRVYGHHSPNRNVTAIIDLLLERCWFEDGVEPFTVVLLPFLECNRHMVDYQHSETRLTALMIACAKGFIDVVGSLLAVGANPYIVGRKSLQAMDWCSRGSANVCWQMLDMEHQAYNDWASKRYLLCEIYHKLYNPFVVDQALVGEIVKHICSEYEPGNVLVMLPDFSAVLECYDLLRRSVLKTWQTMVHFVVCNEFLTEEELKENVPLSTRANSAQHVVILVAEPLLELVSSLFRIDYVVDPGLVVHRSGDYAKGICIDRSCFSTAQRSRFLMWLAQRKCFMLYLEEDIRVDANVKPPIKPLSRMARPETVLKALVLRQRLRRTDRAGSSLEFVCSALFSTCSTSITDSMEKLTQIGAIEKPLSVPTNLGYLLFHLGVSVHLGKALLYSILFRCLDPMITIVAALKVGDPFVEPLSEKGEKEIMHIKFALHNRTYSDCMVLLRLYQQWNQCKANQTDHRMVQQHHLKPGAMEAISNARVELMSLLRFLGIVTCGRGHNIEKLNLNAGNWQMVKGCLAAGFYPQLAMADFKKKQLTAHCGTEIFKAHPLSVAQVDQLPAKWVIFNRKQNHTLNLPQDAKDGKDAQVQLIDNTVISDVTMLLMCGIDRVDTLQTGNLLTRGRVDGRGPVEFIVDQKYLFQLAPEIFDAVLFIRRRLGQLFKEFTLNLLGTVESSETDELVKCIGEVLYAEDLSLMLTSANIDTRPKIRNLVPMGVFWNYSLDMFERT